MHYTQPPWDFLLSASRNTLQSFELSRLSHAANLKKEIAQLLDSWLEENSAASLARLLLDHPEYFIRPSTESESAPADGEAQPRNGHSASYNLFADRAATPATTRGRW